MAVNSRQGIIDYAMRALGYPVVEINVDDSQVQDRVEEALDYFRLYGYDGSEKLFMPYQVTTAVITLQAAPGVAFVKGQQITGATSGSTATVWDVPTTTTIRLINVVPGPKAAAYDNVNYTQQAFTNGETITALAPNTSGVLHATTGYIPGDIQNKWIPISDLVYGVTRILPISSGYGTSASLFDVQYQLYLNDINNIANLDLTYYTQAMTKLRMVDLTLNGTSQIRFNRLTNKLYLDANWANKVAPDQYLVVEGYRALDPAVFTRTWDDAWLKRYLIALIKRQWGANGRKFQGMTLPGGVQVNWLGIYQEADQELKELREELLSRSAPLEFYVG